MIRYINNSISEDLKSKIVLLSGPRQVGKITLSKELKFNHQYLNFDSSEDREIIFKKEWDRKVELVIFDELHKMKNWKSWIKGIYDKEGVRPRIIVTGSARLDVFKKGGDSLAGRHYYYRLHPFCMKELKGSMKNDEIYNRLMLWGGFPEPFLANNKRFSNRWRINHLDRILREDLIDLERVYEIKSIEILIDLLSKRVGSTISYSSLARDLQVSSPTVKKWLEILERLFIIFRVTPFHKNITRSLLKESKYFFYDNGAVAKNQSQRLENLVAISLKKELDFLCDTEGVKGNLHFLRTKNKQEIDFLVEIDQKIIQLIEVKLSDNNFSPHLFYFNKFFPNVLKYQLVQNLKINKTNIDINCQLFNVRDYLSQLNLISYVQE